jgi:hypothetical protein
MLWKRHEFGFFHALFEEGLEMKPEVSVGMVAKTTVSSLYLRIPVSK